MTMTSRLALFALAILTIGGPIGSFAQTGDSQASSNPLPAFTMEIVYHYSDGGSAKAINAFKTDGSFLNAHLSVDGAIVVDRIYSAQNRSETELHHDVKAKSTSYRPSSFGMLSIPKDPTCKTVSQSPFGAETLLGEDEFLGLPVVKHLFQSSNGDVHESWLAPDLGCMAIFTRQTRKETPPGAIYPSGTTATKIVLGDPDPDLFKILADYAEEPPSQIRVERFAKNGWEMTEAVKSSLKYKDEQYWRSQANKPK